MEKISLNNNNKLIYILYIFPICAIYFNYRELPYFFQWDTDATVLIDTLLLNSGLMPEHLNHPSLGLYILSGALLKIISGFGKYFGIVGNFNELAWCSFKWICIENTVKTLLIIPYIIYIFIGFMIVKKSYHYGGSFILSAILIFYYILNDSIFYNILFLKSELFSFLFMFFGAILILDGKNESRYSKVFIGLTLGCLGFLTKIQYVFYLYCILLLYIVKIDSIKDVKFSRKVVVLSIIFYVVLLFIGYKIGHLSKFSGWKTSIINLQFITLILAPYLIILVSNKTEKQNLGQIIVLPLAMLIAAVPTSIIVFGPAVGGAFASDVMAMAFLRSPESVNYVEPTHMLFQYLPSFLILVSICIYVLSAYRKKIHKNIYITMLIIFIVSIVNFFVVFRGIYRDVFPAIWLIILFSMGLSVYIYKSLVKLEKILLCFIFLVASLISPAHSYNSTEIAIIENLHYGFVPNNFFSGVYGGNQNIYSHLMSKADYNPEVRKTFQNSGSKYYLFPNTNKTCLNNQKFDENKHKLLNLTGSNIEIQSAISRGYKVYKFDSTCMAKSKINGSWSLIPGFIVGQPNLDTRDDSVLEIISPSILKTIVISENQIKYNSISYYSRGDGVSDEQWNELAGRDLYKNIGGYYEYLTRLYSNINLNKNQIIYVLHSDVL